MNRVIRFRLWDKKHECFVDEPNYAISLLGTIKIDGRTSIEQKRYVVSQYIGNLYGVDIYEGDTVRTTNEQPHAEPVEEHYYGVVTWNEQKAWYCIVQPHDKYRPVLCNDAIVSIEVLGNVWENSEMVSHVY